MSAQPVASPAVHRHTSAVSSAASYAGVSTSALADSLEAQYDRGEALDPDMVFELVDRLVVAEGRALPAPE
jgi:hypothetical protein